MERVFYKGPIIKVESLTVSLTPISKIITH